MKRILADLPDEDVVWLDAQAQAKGVSRATLLRDAVATYRGKNEGGAADWIEAGFGLWTRNGIHIDPHEYERKRRAEWTRPWDDDYEEVRAESPEMFTEEDDRERAHYLKLLTQRESSGREPDS